MYVWNCFVKKKIFLTSGHRQTDVLDDSWDGDYHHNADILEPTKTNTCTPPTRAENTHRPDALLAILGQGSPWRGPGYREKKFNIRASNSVKETGGNSSVWRCIAEISQWDNSRCAWFDCLPLFPLTIQHLVQNCDVVCFKYVKFVWYWSAPLICAVMLIYSHF